MTTPPDPFRQVDMFAAIYAEKYTAFTAKGIPPIVAAVMLGTEHAILAGVLAALGGGIAEQDGDVTS